MKKLFLIAVLAMILGPLSEAGAQGLGAEPAGVSYRLDLTRPEAGEITVSMGIEATSQPLVLEMPDSYGNGLAVGLSSHVVEEQALDAAGQALPLRRDGNTWHIEHAGRVIFTYKIRVSGYETGSAYLGSLAGKDGPWPFFPLLDADLAYLPGYAVLVHPRGMGGLQPTLQVDLPDGWQTALPWPDQPESMDDLLRNPIYAGDLVRRERDSLLLAIPAAAPAASSGGLDEYAAKAQSILEETEGLLGGCDLTEGRKLLLALLFRGEGDRMEDLYLPSSPYFSTVTLSAPSGNDPLSDATIEATARGVASLLLDREMAVEPEAMWLREGAAWYLQDLIPFQAGMWGASLFWDLFNRRYEAYRSARRHYQGSLAQAGASDNDSEDANVVLLCGGASACATLDCELRSLGPSALDLPFFLRDLAGRGSAAHPLSNDDVRSLLEALTGRDWSAFFRDHIQGAREIPASSFSSLNVTGPGAAAVPAEGPEASTSTSGWVLLAVAVVVVFLIPFVLEPYTMRPRRPGFLKKKLDDS